MWSAKREHRSKQYTGDSFESDSDPQCGVWQTVPRGEAEGSVLQDS